MHHMTLKKSLFIALAVGCSVTLAANSASAHLFGRGGSCGSSGGSWGGSYGGSWGGSHGSWGGGSYGSGGSCGSCGSYGGGYAYYGGYYGGGYASSRVIYDGVVVAAKPAADVKTRLTIHVPADAKVTLAGVETKQTGAVRQFATTRLSSGQTWDGYKVVAEVKQNGQTLREERTIKLTGGEAQELSINFDSTKVAKN
jgi:uncharacterized protein (TIGR03000 family)